MKEIIILDKETVTHILQTLRQCRTWLNTDARFSHARSNIRVVGDNVNVAISKINLDIDKFKDNTKILTEKINELNSEV